jgi:hypothetical protein
VEVTEEIYMGTHEKIPVDPYSGRRVVVSSWTDTILEESRRDLLWPD